MLAFDASFVSGGYGPPLEVYNNPSNTFVAQFIGSPGMNLLNCRIIENAGKIALNFGEVGSIKIVDEGLLRACRNARRSEVIYGIRPEHITLTRGCRAFDSIELSVKFTEKIGARTIVHLAGRDMELKVTVNGRSSIRVGENLGIVPYSGAHHLFDLQSGRVIR
jgi:multiple sugar transport system ATP-binding protein